MWVIVEPSYGVGKTLYRLISVIKPNPKRGVKLVSIGVGLFLIGLLDGYLR